MFNKEEVPGIREGCESGKLGCVECKKNCAKKIIQFLSPFREKRNALLEKKNEVKEILDEGCKRARDFAERTMYEVREKMNMWK